MNKVIVIGNLTEDPQRRNVNTADGESVVCNFTVAANRIVRGEKVTAYFRVSCWGRQAENAMKYLAKGKRVAVTGPVEARAYIARDGSARATLEVRAMEIEYLSGRQDEAPTAAHDAGAGAAREDEFTEIEDIELPF